MVICLLSGAYDPRERRIRRRVSTRFVRSVLFFRALPRFDVTLRRRRLRRRRSRSIGRRRRRERVGGTGEGWTMLLWGWLWLRFMWWHVVEFGAELAVVVDVDDHGIGLF